MKTSSLIILTLFAAFVFELGVNASIARSMANNGLQQCVDSGKVVWKYECGPKIKRVIGA